MADQDFADKRMLNIANSICRIGRRIMVNEPQFDAALKGRSVSDAVPSRLLTIRQVSKRHPGMTETAVRQLLRRCEEAAKAQED